ncbi:hypothetical protein GGS21DRAFT_351828 [Xylaria nigripes]|nr:hypothetical protein GGS21DRAFT_351828 [Xylaria nigripes]
MEFGPSAEELQWQYEHHDETRRASVITTCAATAAISLIVVALRLFSRHLLHRKLLLDASDWLILIAWVFLTTICIIWAIGTEYGIGRHSVVVTDFRKVQILAITGEVIYVLAIAFVKFSVLAFYSKTSSVQRLRYLIWGATIVVTGWALSSAMVAIFRCSPIEYVWRPDIEGFCIDLGVKNRVSGITNILTDAFIMGMAIPLVWSLKLSKQEKWLVTAVFAVGSSTCILSIVRLTFATKIGTSDGTWAAVPTVIVSLVETTVGMLAVSMPTYLPFFKRTLRSKSSTRSNLASRASTCYKDALHMRLYGREGRNQVKVTSPGMHTEAEHGGINVTNHIELIRHTNKSGSWVRVNEEDEEELCKSAERYQVQP